MNDASLPGGRPDANDQPPETIAAGAADMRDVLSRIIAAADALDAGDADEARVLISGLEQDLGRQLRADRRPFTCPRCPLTFRWPGERDRHIMIAHAVEDAA